ncbi:MAG: transglutaminase family protein [Ferruginibacter sp.]
MGGEPTFVSIDDMESAQWNTDADGKEKRILSHDLIFKLREKFGPSGMLHYGQGKCIPVNLCHAGNTDCSGEQMVILFGKTLI